MSPTGHGEVFVWEFGYATVTQYRNTSDQMVRERYWHIERQTGHHGDRYAPSSAQCLLVDRQMNPRVVMQVGGWDNFQAIEPYLNAPMPEVVNEAFEEAGLA